MKQRHPQSIEEKEKFFHTLLVQYGVAYERAAKAAKILASGQPDELLSPDEVAFTKEVCSEWFEYRKRRDTVLAATLRLN